MCVLTACIGSSEEHDREKRIVHQLYVTRGEEQVVRYVRARVRGYRRRLLDEAQKLANEAAEVLALVG